ncbi:MAG TPA: xanthine dehydrogenase family protein subunit M [Firmicutes bacterium]|jgi:xanthine dehydrogenase YagS FAD-binding subunit|nr:xanthine dehydrogenase family protein subunit M [Bacillota bacterium]
MRSFQHINVFTLEEAVSVLKDSGGKAQVIAGGTDIIGVLKEQILPDYPEILLNIKAIPDLDYIKKDHEGLRIGPLAKLAGLAKSPAVREKYGALAQAARSVGSPQIRNMATIGGNLCQETRCWYYRYPHSIGGRLLCLRKGSGSCLAVNGDNRYHALFDARRCFAACPSDVAVALLLLGAEINILGIGGKRTVYLQDFFHPLGNALEPGEIIGGIHIPTPPVGAKQQFLKFTLRKPIDFAVVSAAALIVLDGGICTEARIALGAVAPGPRRFPEAENFLKGKRLETNVLEKAAGIALEGAKPLSKNGYKIEIAKTLISRALSACLENESFNH